MNRQNNFKDKIKMNTQVFRFGLSILFAASFLFLVPDRVSATHIVGGNLTYRRVTSDVYQVRLTLRRDCLLGSPEAQFDDPASIGIFTPSGALITSLANNGEIRLRFNSSDTLNQYIRSDCGFEGTQVCVHETTYQGLVRLPYRQGGYILAYQRCCRNETLANIVNPLETGATYWIQITDDAQLLNNSAPSFKEWPDVYICANNLHTFDHSATDIDGDSLVYKLCVPNTGATIQFPRPQPPGSPPYNTVQWRSPYSLNDMLGGDVPLTIHPQTGIITLNPNLVGQFLVGVCVEEYRNGKLLSTVRRDFQYNVRVCSPPPKAQFTTSESNCDGLTVEFFNNSISSSNYRWYFDFPNESPAFMSTERNPVFTYPQSGIYTVKLRATRGSDGCFDTILQQVMVFTNKIEPEFSYVLSGCDPEDNTVRIRMTDLSAFDEPGFSVNVWEWTVIQGNDTTRYNVQNPEIVLQDDQNALIKLSLFANNGCTATIEKEINISELQPAIDFSIDFGGCPQGGQAELILTDLSAPLNPLAPIVAQNWRIGTNIYSGATVNAGVPANSGVVKVMHSIVLGDGCTIEDEKEINLEEFVPRTEFALVPDNCPDDNNVTVKIRYIDTLSNNVPVSSIVWTAGITNGLDTYNVDSFFITVPKDSQVYVLCNTTFANGCEDELERWIEIGPFASVSFQADPIILCPDQSKFLIKNGNPAWSYTWSPVEGLDLTEPHNPKVKISENRTYAVTVSDGVCEAYGSVNVVALTGGIDLTITGTPDICDKNVNLFVSGGIGEGEYTWSTDPSFNFIVGNGQNLQTELDANVTTYYAQFVGESCSTMPAVFTVTRQTPRLLVASPFIMCPGDTITLPVFNEVATHQLTYEWQPDPRIIGPLNTSQIRVGVGKNQTADFDLYLRVVNQFGCELIDTVKIIMNQNPVVDFDYELQNCGEFKICFKIQGQYNGFVRWEFGDPGSENDFSFERDPCYTYTAPGSFSVRLQNLVGVCPFVSPVKEVVVNPQVQLQPIGPFEFCKDTTVALQAVANLSDIRYSWFDDKGNQISSGPNVNYPVTSNAKIKLVARDIYGCSDSIDVSFSLFTFNYSVSVKDSICNDENATINLNIQNPQDFDFIWLPSDKIISGNGTTSVVVKGEQGLSLSVIVRNKALGCLDTTRVTPRVIPPFVFDISGPQVFCFDEPGTIRVLIQNPENYNFSWSPSSAFISGAQTATPVGRFRNSVPLTVTLTNRITGCVQNAQFIPNVGQPVDISVNAEPDLTIYEGEEIEIKVTNPIAAATYVWSTGATGLSIKVAPVETTTYTVTVTDRDGCTAVDQVTVEVRRARCDETDVYLPNAFTPNGDGNNDRLFVRSNFIDEMELIIYNRWGQQVFRTTDQSVGWDGTFEGKELPPDAYAYYLRVICVNAVEYRKKGNVNLIR
ncbi:MAG: gliding motility-associated C-terminal domain-containing protein [Saprospiraceae bacterium]|nr:gliding motility-associated C-terminal domain-containing protein [Saprospiraceae bacterium]